MPYVQEKPERPKIALIGGGIAGLTLSLGLYHAGVPFHVYEAAPAFTEIGAGVGLAPNAQRAMSLIHPSIRAAYDKFATTNYDKPNKQYYFEFRMGMPGNKVGPAADYAPGDLLAQPGGEGKGMSMINRSHFLSELASLLPAEYVTFGKRLQRLEQDTKDVKLYFEDGTTATVDVVLGCDGVKSRVRSSVFGKESAPVFSGKYAYRGLVPMSKAITVVGEQRARNSQAYLGYGGHVLTMPVDNQETMNVVAFRTKTDSTWEDERWVLPMRQEDIKADFADWSEDVRGILGLLQKTDTWALFDHPRLNSLWNGRICLIGDAAHATTPHQGSGAAMAIEDAYVMSKLLELTADVQDIEAVFTAFDVARKERTMKVVETSREAGNVYEFLHQGIMDDPALIEENLKTRYDWIWDEDLEEQCALALHMYEDLRVSPN